ncbi:MAG: hypothetical protein J6R26_06715 [Paludibacteraceae bacterium]|nr:hypothetical protein [Paludibacteraceae bacterium]
MKKTILLVALLALVGLGTTYAQPRAIGINAGYGVDLSYQHAFGSASMLDVSVNVPQFMGIGGSVTYDWINPFGTSVPWQFQGKWNWYLGLGAGAGVYDLFKKDVDMSWYLGAVAHVGIEYNFWFPLQLSLDYRPNIGVVNAGSFAFNPGGLYGVSLGVRYLF